MRRDGSITSRLEVTVSAEDDVELRRVTLTNHGTDTRDIELTSYAELVLAPPATDAAYPAFSNMFVRTECIAERATLLAVRRPSAAEEAELWMGHVLAVDGDTVGALQWETDRSQFLGRGRAIRNPVAFDNGRALTNTVGPVLDPIVSLRHRLRIRPGESRRATFSTVIASSRQAVLELADKYRDAAAFERAVTTLRTHAEVRSQELGLQVGGADMFQPNEGAHGNVA